MSAQTAGVSSPFRAAKLRKFLLLRKFSGNLCANFFAKVARGAVKWLCVNAQAREQSLISNPPQQKIKSSPTQILLNENSNSPRRKFSPTQILLSEKLKSSSTKIQILPDLNPPNENSNPPSTQISSDMFDDFGGDASYYHVGGDVFCDDGSGGDDGVVANRYAGGDHDVGAYPYAVADSDWCVVEVLSFRGVVVVVECGEHDAVPYEASVADEYAALVLEVAA